jgi:hypothetical protein
MVPSVLGGFAPLKESVTVNGAKVKVGVVNDAEVSGVKAPLQVAVTLFVPLAAAGGPDLNKQLYGTAYLTELAGTLTLDEYVQVAPDRDNVSLRLTVTLSQSFGLVT